jgi:O-antigen/teichoic acid export membrane protein
MPFLSPVTRRAKKPDGQGAGSSVVLWLRSLVGIRDADGHRSHLSIRRYGVLTGVALSLTGLQVLLMPRWLSAEEFGLVVLAISATQGILQFGDLGLARLCIDASRTADERAKLRAQGLALTVFITAALIAVGACVGLFLSESGRTLLAALALGGLAAALVAGDKFRATREEVIGDEVQAAGLNFVWTNAPKIGLLAGVVLFRDALAVATVGVVVAGFLGRPRLARPADAWQAIRRVRLWGTPFVAIASSFVLAWSDTYFLVAHLGVARAGSYEALYRVLGVSSYFFLPWTSVITSRASVDERRPLLGPLLISLCATAIAIGCAVAFVYTLAPTFFTNFELPLEAVPGLVCYYLLLPVSFALGAALYVKSAARAVTRAVAVSAVAALVGHAIFTLRGGPLQASVVAAASMGLAVLLQGLAYMRTSGHRAPSELDDDALPGREGDDLLRPA